MTGIIKKHNLELMSRYPNDLLVHDRAFLEKMALPGTKIAWMVGDSHSHIVALGIEKEQNEMVNCLTNLGNNDKFYLLTIHSINGFSFSEMNRDEFNALANTPLIYTTSSTDISSFWLMRDRVKLGFISVESIGNMQEPKMRGEVTPIEGISTMDNAALDFWVGHAITKTAGSLFVKSETVWKEPIPQQKM